MTDEERRRWKRNARKAEGYLMSVLLDSEGSSVQRMKAAELVLYRYYGRPGVEKLEGSDGGEVAFKIDFGDHPEYAD